MALCQDCRDPPGNTKLRVNRVPWLDFASKGVQSSFVVCSSCFKSYIGYVFWIDVIFGLQGKRRVYRGVNSPTAWIRFNRNIRTFKVAPGSLRQDVSVILTVVIYFKEPALSLETVLRTGYPFTRERAPL